MEQLNKNVQPGTHNDDTRRTDTTTHTFGSVTNDMEFELEIQVIKEEPDSLDAFNFDVESSELIDNGQMWASTMQSSNDVTTEQSTADMGNEEPAVLPVTQLMDAVNVPLDHTSHDCQLLQSTLQSSDDVATDKPAVDIGYEEPTPPPPATETVDAIRLRLIGPCAGYVRLTTAMLPTNPAARQDCLHCCIPARRQIKSDTGQLLVPRKEKVKYRRRTRLKVSSHRNVHGRKVVPMERKTNNECVSNSRYCTRKSDEKKQDKYIASFKTKPKKSRTRQKSYPCEVCQKCFSLKGNLQTHILTHVEYRPYKCKVCIKSYYRKSHLKRHNLSHTGDRPYKCDRCDKGFTDPSDLKRHIRTHTGEKPYKCNICSKRFKEKGALTSHTRTHTGEKPYKCKICDMRFSQYSSLHNHISTSKKTYKCKLCKKPFCFPTYIKKHNCSDTKNKPYNFRSEKK